MSPSSESATVSEHQSTKPDQSKSSYPWYLENIDKYLLPDTQELLVEYSHVSRDKQSEHIHSIRDQAWKIRTYPCTGLGLWLVPYISRSPAYWAILQRLQAGETFLDIGCFLGGDMRKLAFDGAPSSRMYGVDIADYWDVGFEMYRDKETFNAHFIEADLLSKNSNLDELKGKADIISISAVLHQWNWKGQVEAAKRVVDFSMPGTIVVGHQIGNVVGKEVFNEAIQVPQWRHDPHTFEEMWNQVGKETGTTWQTKADLKTWEDMGWDPSDSKWLEQGDSVVDFVVTRVA